MTLANSGSITANGYVAYGAVAQAKASGTAISATNTGTIDVDTAGGALYAGGIVVKSVYENSGIVVNNGGEITVDSAYNSSGINVVAGANGDTATVTNSGTIIATAREKYADAYGATVSVAGDATFTNAAGGVIDVNGGYARGALVISAGGLSLIHI